MLELIQKPWRRLKQRYEKSGLAQFLSWWRSELLAALPPAWRAWLASEAAVVTIAPNADGWLLRRMRAGSVETEARAGGEYPALTEVAERLRTETSSNIDRARTELRACFSEEERTLLILRLEEGLAWRDLARVFLDERATDEDLDRESARLRKRFQLAKDRFVEAARARGLLR